MDYTLLFIVIFLLGFGLVMVYSTSSYSANLQFDGDAAWYFRKQLWATAVGIVAMMVVANIPYHFWEQFAMLYCFRYFDFVDYSFRNGIPRRQKMA